MRSIKACARIVRPCSIIYAEHQARRRHGRGLGQSGQSDFYLIVWYDSSRVRTTDLNQLEVDAQTSTMLNPKWKHRVHGRLVDPVDSSIVCKIDTF